MTIWNVFRVACDGAADTITDQTSWNLCNGACEGAPDIILLTFAIVLGMFTSTFTILPPTLLTGDGSRGNR